VKPERSASDAPSLELAGVRAAVAASGVAVVTLFSGVERCVAAVLQQLEDGWERVAAQ